MFGLNLEENLHLRNEKLLKELVLKSDQQEAEFEKIYREHKISKEALLAFLGDPANFDKETWEKMQKIRSEYAQEIQNKLNQIKDPLKAKKSFNELKQAQQWIFVR